MQACCDYNCLFTHYSVKFPGGSNDSFSLTRCKLHELIESTPEGFWVSGDNAYKISSKLLVPYAGREKYDTSKSVFNFYLNLENRNNLLATFFMNQ